MPASVTFRDEAHRLIDELPDNASWEDLIDRIYVRKAIETGLDEVAAGRTMPVEEVRRRLGLPA